MTIDIKRFDAANYLKDDEDIKIFLEEASKDAPPEHFVNALATAIRAKGVNETAELAGLTPKSLYKFPGERTQFNTVCKLASAFGLKLEFHA